MDMIKRPIIGLAPMDGITDAPFRYIVEKHGRPDVLRTEFIPVELFKFNPDKAKQLMFRYPSKAPLLVQLVGTNPELFYFAALTAIRHGCEGIDINMGCPDTGTVKKGAGAALILNPNLAKRIVENVKKATDEMYKSSGIKIPVSIKTRIGYEKPITKDWMSQLVDMHPDMIAVHGRTALQKYSGLADWEEIAIAAEIAKKNKILFLGNGDIQNKKEALKKIEKYDIDGVLIGRAALGNPWIFSGETPDLKTRMNVMIEHCEKFQEFRRDMKDIVPMRKHLAWYCTGFHGSARIRDAMTKVCTVGDVKKIAESLFLDVENPGIDGRA
ncbi:hypothetical protein COT62_02425 [Candidatus Roizmanbacteria bacterium CG09_land_8_20_14_0_10_41_9]|uniref:tRNA-dihydrouridine synthase n=1 Tax=Candidatus Roizmanbacteria bacterium CG09_land_8_20_14_0_10_41_9 TaxID=1974850 RepID=A0A2H0WSK2_9BACT|nr:MAG: hypothetical protein COT62_02425 [Candidatus Roizmanbacteria bacterium CG09_land_8_20_14_0_10_41_9]